MILRVLAIDTLKGIVFLPASKSYSIRAYIVSALGGQSNIIHPSDCDDAIVASQIARSLGAKIKRLKDNCWKIQANPIGTIPKIINVKESGTTLRLLLPLICFRNQSTKITGEGTLIGRPNQYLTQTLREMGADIRGHGENESVPIAFKSGNIKGGEVSINGSISSQFISALLMLLPLLNEDTRLKLNGKLVSLDYITMTLQILKESGVKIFQKSGRFYIIKGRQEYKGLDNFTVPSDDGLAAFLLAAAALTKSDITLTGHFDDRYIQADGQIYVLLIRMGVKFKKTRSFIKIKGPFRLIGGTFSLKDCPDLLPIMAVLSLFAHGTTILKDIAHARVKESDRISDLRNELLKIGAEITESKDRLIIKPKSTYRKDCILDPHNDHRLAMAFCVLGIKIGVRVKDIECTRKSYPAFINDFKTLGAKVLSSKK